MQTPADRRRMLNQMGLAPALPSVHTQRYWAMIDDRVIPDGEPDGQFSSFIQWVNKASSWIGFTGSKCYDAKDRPCRIGGDFMRARDEDAFPVRWYGPERFTAPLQRLLTPSELSVLTAISGAPGCFLPTDEIKVESGSRRVSRNLLAGLVSKGFLQTQETGFSMGEAELADFAFEKIRQRRVASARRF